MFPAGFNSGRDRCRSRRKSCGVLALLLVGCFPVALLLFSDRLVDQPAPTEPGRGTAEQRAATTAPLQTSLKRQFHSRSCVQPEK